MCRPTYTRRWAISAALRAGDHSWKRNLSRSRARSAAIRISSEYRTRGRSSALRSRAMKHSGNRRCNGSPRFANKRHICGETVRAEWPPRLELPRRGSAHRAALGSDTAAGPVATAHTAKLLRWRFLSCVTDRHETPLAFAYTARLLLLSPCRRQPRSFRPPFVTASARDQRA